MKSLYALLFILSDSIQDSLQTNCTYVIIKRVEQAHEEFFIGQMGSVYMGFCPNPWSEDWNVRCVDRNVVQYVKFPVKFRKTPSVLLSITHFDAV